MTKKKMDSCLLLSFSYFALRYAFAIPEDKPIGYVSSLIISSIYEIIEEMNCDSVIVIFDAPDANFTRKSINKTYKENRVKSPMPKYVKDRLVEAGRRVKSLGIEFVETPKVEADDSICSLVYQHPKVNFHVIDQDKDLLALLVCDNYTQWKMGDNKMINMDKEYCISKFGVLPSQIEDYLSIAGDVADGIQGVKGIGGSGAASLLTNYGNCDNIFNIDLSEISDTPMIKKIKIIQSEEGKEQYYMAKSLVEMARDLDINVKFKSKTSALLMDRVSKTVKFFDEGL
jgi:DNA polymerase I